MLVFDSWNCALLELRANHLVKGLANRASPFLMESHAVEATTLLQLNQCENRYRTLPKLSRKTQNPLLQLPLATHNNA
jgi:hypothetical protein